jgi:hypothetical protein
MDFQHILNCSLLESIANIAANEDYYSLYQLICRGAKIKWQVLMLELGGTAPLRTHRNPQFLFKSFSIFNPFLIKKICNMEQQ